MTLITNSTPAERNRGCIFAENFENSDEVVRNGGTIVSAPTVNNGLTTDGTDDEVTYAESTNSVKSISFWITLETTTENIMQLSASHSIEAGSGTLTATGVTSPTFYVDGTATATITTARSHVVITTGTAFDADDIQIGQDASFGQFKIEELKMWDVTLTAQEASDLANNTTYDYINEAVLDLPMGMAQHDPTNTRTSDISETGANATLVNAPTKLTDTTGYTFNGSNQYMTLPGAGVFNTANLSILFDFTPVGAAADDTYYVLMDGADGGTRYGIHKTANANSNTLAILCGGTVVEFIALSIYENYWWANTRNTLVLTSTTGNINVWLNGQQILTSDTTAWTPADPTTVYVGSSFLPGSYFSGDMHHVKVWQKLLTPTQVQDISHRVLKKTNDI